jgi:hypothetical protein
MLRTSKICVVGLIAFLAFTVSSSPASAGSELECKMTFKLKGWSAFYKTSSGEGTITCSNGQSVAVKIKLTGGGLTFGKTETKDGFGKFSDVGKIDDLLGSYAQAEAEAGAVKSAEAQVLTKGEVSLALSGTGSGWSLGVSGAKFTITKK